MANPSFGAGEDNKIEHYTNFNDYFNDSPAQKIFASELEMISGLDLTTIGFSDLTRYIFWIDYVIESAVYIALIEGILALEEIAIPDKKTNTQIAEDFQMELGNYGSISYSVITRYIYEILKYPKHSRARKGSSGIFDRLGAFYIGLSFFVNTDPLLFLSKFGESNEDLATGQSTIGQAGGALSSIPIVGPISSFEVVQNILYYLIESFTTLSGIGRQRLIMLIRRFHMKGDWYSNKLFKAKSDALTSNTPPENFLVQLNYYYVTFIIERMNIGLKLKNYYRNKKSKINRLNRSGRVKDSNGLFTLNYDSNTKSAVVVPYKPVEKNLKNKISQKQSMSISSLPQAFIMPKSFLQSFDIASYGDSNKFSEAFLEEHVASYFIKTDKPQERLSRKVVAELEEFYEKEMMPFYFQDIRTNEIIGFHAFIESYTDQFSPQYQETTPGYGRIDKVSHYVNTSRNINITFTLASMSKEDHDLMWYQINKLVSMVYPQWSSGFKKSTKLNEKILNYEFPFTQVPIASPLIRIRLGDVLKSNYSTHAMEKIHGSGNIKYEGSPVSNYTLPNEKLQNPIENDNKNYTKKTYILPGKYKKLNGEYIKVSDLKEVLTTKLDEKFSLVNFMDKKLEFGLMGPVPSPEIFNESVSGQVDNKSIVTYISPISTKSSPLTKDNLPGAELSQGIKQFTSSFVEDRVNNPFTAAQETTLGKGLAGFIKSLDVNSQDQLWETSVKGSKAPMAVKITIAFEPIHDIPPGLDSDGAMRAPVYNTGRIINTLYGDVYDTNKAKKEE